MDIIPPFNSGGSVNPSTGLADHIPAGTATAATVTAGSYVAWAGFTSAAITVVITGINLTAGDVQVNFSNDAGVTVGTWISLGSLTGGLTETKVYNLTNTTSPGSTGTFFQVRLANGVGLFTSTTISVQVAFSE